jgi:hypothetical protein
MESQQQQSSSRKGFGGVTVLALIILAFGGGVYVGLHPQWVPLKTSNNPDLSGMSTRNSSVDDHSMPATLPSTKP